MIEINLLPGDGKKKRRAKTSSPAKFEFNLKPPPWLAGLTEKITDKYMLGAVAAAGISGALIVFMFIHQAAKASELDDRETKAVKDSAQFGAVLAAKAKAEAAEAQAKIQNNFYLLQVLKSQSLSKIDFLIFLNEWSYYILTGTCFSGRIIQKDEPISFCPFAYILPW